MLFEHRICPVALLSFQAEPNSGEIITDKLKLLMVHGIGNHEPGYSRRLQDGLIAEFGFESTDETIKTITLSQPNYEHSLGVLRVHRYMNLQQSQEMLVSGFGRDFGQQEVHERCEFIESIPSD